MALSSKLISIKFLAAVMALSFLFFSCGDQRYKHIRMFNNRPIPPKRVPRHLLGKYPTGAFESHKVGGIVVMDSGADYRGETSLTYLQNMLERYSTNKKQGDLPAHYFIDREGIIYVGRNPITPARFHVGDAFLQRPEDLDELGRAKARMAWRTNDRLDLKSYIVIMFLGDYDNHIVNEEQEKNFFQLLAFLVHRYSISLHNVLPLNQLYPEGENPGFYLRTYIQHPVLAKNIPPAPMEHRFLAPPRGANILNP